jgi:2-amino-4-hydroxy-6-hydroxymethyldihydropteridine diphosphokinase
MRAYVAVGSNLGDRWARLVLAGRALREAPGVAVLRASRVWDAAPIGPPQPRYLNAVLELETTRTPRSLLGLLQEVERAALRTRDVHWGARTLDLDLILFADLTIREQGLTVPHPGMEERRFVLAPLAELHPELIVPGLGVSVWRLLEESPELDLEPVGGYPL